jgi:hypothetical protein
MITSRLALADKAAPSALARRKRRQNADQPSLSKLDEMHFRDWNTMCDDTLECLWYLLALLLMMVVPPLLLCWIWCGLLR